MSESIDVPDNDFLRRIGISVQATERGMRGLPPRMGESGGPLSFPLHLYELASDPVLDDKSKCYKATGYPCMLRYCVVDGGGHFTPSANAGEDKSGTLPRWLKSTADAAETIWFPAGKVDANQEYSTAPTAKALDRVYVSSKENRLVVVACDPGEATVRFRLLGDLRACESAEAEILIELPASASQSSSDSSAKDCTCGKFKSGGKITVIDRIGKVGDSFLAETDEGGNLFIPANTMGHGTRFADTPNTTPQTYEATGFGESTCDHDSASGSGSDSSSGTHCLHVDQSVLANVPTAGSNFVPTHLLGKDASGCMAWVPVEENCGQSSS
jgi:hypothetical protein